MDKQVVARQGLEPAPGIDPEVAVAVTLAQAEVVRIQAEAWLLTEGQPSGAAYLRDLSPFGR